MQSYADELRGSGWEVENHGLRRPGRADEPGTAIRNIYWPFDGGQHGLIGRTLWHAIDTMTLSSASIVGRLMDESMPDAIITHNLRGWGYAPWVVAAERGIPLIHVIHDYGLLCSASTLWHDGETCSGTFAPCRFRLRNTMARWPGGHIVGVSRAVLEEHRRLGFAPAGDGTVLHPVAGAHRATARSRPAVSGSPKVLGYLGRLSAEKGIGELVDAISGTDISLVIAGDGDLLARVRGETTGQVQWRGWIEPSALFEAIDVLVVPSQWREPFGLVVVEAARAGVPVLLADQPGLVEAAEAAGARYLTYPANDSVALQNSFDTPLADYRVARAPKSGAGIAQLVEDAIEAERVRWNA